MEKALRVDASIIKADAQRQRGVPGGEPIDWGNPEAAARPVREYLAALEEAEPSARDRSHAQAISLTDPGCSLDRGTGWQAFFAYSTNYLIDLKRGSSSMSKQPPRSGRLKFWPPNA